MCAKCGKPTVYPERYCEGCRGVVAQEVEARKVETKAKADKAYNERRDPKYIKFYKSPAWRMLSARYLQDHQWQCESCGGLAVEVHHITPIQSEEGWGRRLDQKNLTAVCVKCHNQKHGRFQKRRDRTK